MSHVEIILKVTERCNLNCTYCYFFNKENKDFEDHPALISTETVRQLVRFLRTSSQQVSDTTYQIDLHGGEPLLLGPKRFSEIVSIIADGLSDSKDIRFTVQTNGALINQTWIDVFARHQICVGISVDGPKAQHDANRVDKRGRGTFDNMVPKIATVKQAATEGRVPAFGAICVISPQSDARLTYECLTKELGFSKLQFLFPDDTHDSKNLAHTASFMKFVDDLFDCWENDENKNVRVDLIDRTLHGILHEKLSEESGHGTNPASAAMVMTVSSAGDIGHDDTLRNVVPELFNSGMNVADAMFPQFLAWHFMISGLLAPKPVTAACASCSWRSICEHVTSGDTPLHRMKSGSADQPSIYCEPLKAIYLKSAKYLAKRGVPIQRISRNLISSN